MAKSSATGVVATMLEGMHSILTFVVGIAGLLFHVWTCVIIYNTWGFKLAFPAFLLPVFSETAVLFSEWHEHDHRWLTHYGLCYFVIAMGFVIASLTGNLAAQARRNSPQD